VALRFDHIAHEVDCVNTAVSWCVDKLSAKILKCHDDWALLLVGGTMMAFTQRGKHPSHIAFSVDSLSDMPCKKEDIKQHRDGSFYYYEEAPDGYIIEWLYWPKRRQT